jgi:hypothetical protein
VNTAAAATQSGSNLTLYVAIIGIIGTLTAALVTQWWSSRRDEKQWERQKKLQDERFDREREREEERWQREREQESERWARERQERSEQWNREDAARLYQDRLGAYSQLLTHSQEMLDSAHRVVESIPDNDESAAEFYGISANTVAEYQENLDRYLSARVSIRLIGSRVVNEMAAKVGLHALRIRVHTRAAEAREGNDRIPAERYKHIADDSIGQALALGGAIRELEFAIRKDIGSDPLDQMQSK